MFIKRTLKQGSAVFCEKIRTNSQQPTAKARYRLPGINNHDALLVSTMHYRDAKVEENCIDHVCNMAPAWRVPMT